MKKQLAIYLSGLAIGLTLYFIVATILWYSGDRSAVSYAVSGLSTGVAGQFISNWIFKSL